MFVDEFNEDRTGWARFSNDKRMRYRLARSIHGRPLDVGWGRVFSAGLAGLPEADLSVCFLMLNPSTADAFRNDPTISRGVAFARSWGASIYEAVNIDAFRATNPNELYKLACGERGDDPVNNEQILLAAKSAFRVIAAWGTHGELDGRGTLVRRMLADAGVTLYHLGLTKGGHPKHPLYLKGGTEPQVWPHP